MPLITGREPIYFGVDINQTIIARNRSHVRAQFQAMVPPVVWFGCKLAVQRAACVLQGAVSFNKAVT
eukprot:1138875-Pelagomonas_calceolata.AAC.1